MPSFSFVYLSTVLCLNGLIGLIIDGDCEMEEMEKVENEGDGDEEGVEKEEKQASKTNTSENERPPKKKGRCLVSLLFPSPSPANKGQTQYIRHVYLYCVLHTTRLLTRIPANHFLSCLCVFFRRHHQKGDRENQLSHGPLLSMFPCFHAGPGMVCN